FAGLDVPGCRKSLLRRNHVAARRVAEHALFVGRPVGTEYGKGDGGKSNGDDGPGSGGVFVHLAVTSRLSKWMGVSELPKRAGAPEAIGSGSTISIDHASGSGASRRQTLPRISALPSAR